MRYLTGLLFGALLFSLIPPNVHSQTKAVPVPSFKHLDGRKIVFVANGVGDSTRASDALSQVNGDLQLGLVIKSVAWTRMDSGLRDLVDLEAQSCAAEKIAVWTRALRKDAPHAEIYYVGHSAGAHIVLRAAEMAGEKNVDRIVLLSAAVSHCYDLKPALKASRCGIDSFWASEDTVLERAAETVGMADGVMAPAGGRVAFHPADKSDLYRNLRQYRWNETYHGSGGHFAWTMPINMKKTVAPLLLTR